MKSGKLLAIAIILISAAACSNGGVPSILPAVPDGVQGISMLGDTLYTSAASGEAAERFSTNLQESIAQLEANPGDPDALVWKGRWTAYLGEYRDAIDIYTEGIVKHPTDARFLRHRGHRLISIREFDLAIADYTQAVSLIEGTEDSVEPDGLPNSRNIPVSTLHNNIWYHLGLAYYLKNDMENALHAYQECLKASKNPDMVAASSHWLYMILRRLDRKEEAYNILEPITADMDIIENQAYHKLLLFYKGEMTEEQLTGGSLEDSSNAAVMYGLGNWYYYNGDPGKAEVIYKMILARNAWAGFGYIAAEADLSKM